MTARAGLDRQTVIQAAVEIVDTQGLPGLTLALLANHLGVRTPSLYNHITSLLDLHHELARRGTSDLLKRFSQAAIGKSGSQAVFALTYAYRAYAKEHPGLYALTQLAPAPDDLAMHTISQEIIDVTLAVLSAYQLQGVEAIHAVRALRSLVHGFVSLETNGGFGIPLDLDESYTYLIKTFLDGLEHSANARKHNNRS